VLLVKGHSKRTYAEYASMRGATLDASAGSIHGAQREERRREGVLSFVVRWLGSRGTAGLRVRRPNGVTLPGVPGR